MERRWDVLLRRCNDVPIRRPGDVPLRLHGDVPPRRYWVFRLRRTCNVAGTYIKTLLRRCHDILLPGGPPSLRRLIYVSYRSGRCRPRWDVIKTSQPVCEWDRSIQDALLKSRSHVPIRRLGDVPLRSLGNVPPRGRWVFHFRCICDVSGTYIKTLLRCSHDVLLPDGFYLLI